MKPEPQTEGKHNFSIPLNAKPIPMASLVTEVHDGVDRAGGSENNEEKTIDSEKSLLEVQTSFPREVIVKQVHDGVDRAGGSENNEEKTIDSEKSLLEVQTSFPREVIVKQVKDHDINNFEGTDSNEKRMITDLSFENDPIKKEATSRDSCAATEQAATGKLETREAEITHVGSAKEEGDEFEKINPSSNDGTLMIKRSEDTNTKASHKKSHGILSGVGSKVKHSISKVKKAITGKSSHPKTPSPNKLSSRQ